MADTDEDIIAEMRRAMCAASGKKWFESAKWYSGLPFFKVVAWEDVYDGPARRQLAAHRAMLKAMEEGE